MFLKKIKSPKILIPAIAVVAISAIFGWRLFFAFAQSVIDYFDDDNLIADTWNIDVSTTTGEIKLAEQACNDTDYFCSENAVCANTYGDGEYIVVARANTATTKQWKTTNTDCNLPECGQDGAQSTDNLVADNTVNFASYPARQACKDMGGRLPTITELSCLYTNRATFGNNFGTGGFWSATELSTTLARLVGFSDGGTLYNDKAGSFYVRCVVGW